MLALLGRHGAMRIGKLTELLGVDTSATSHHVTHGVVARTGAGFGRAAMA